MKTSIIGGIIGAALFVGSLGLGAMATDTNGLVSPAFADAKGKKSPAETTGIEWHIEPAGVEIYLNGKKLGEAGKLTFTQTKPGKHSVRLVHVKDETEIDIEVKKGQTLKFTFTFEDG